VSANRPISGADRVLAKHREGGYVIDFKVGQSFGEPQDAGAYIKSTTRRFKTIAQAVAHENRVIASKLEKGYQR